MSEQVSAVATIEAPAAVVFAALADPATHAAVDGTGWVRASIDDDSITAAGQVFHMAMFHADHPDGEYETANEVTVFDPPRSIAWRTGTESPSGERSYGGWWWRYDLAPVGPTTTTVTLTYDWSDVGPEVRSYLTFPPFEEGHLARSLAHLAGIVE